VVCLFDILFTDVVQRIFMGTLDDASYTVNRRANNMHPDCCHCRNDTGCIMLNYVQLVR